MGRAGLVKKVVTVKGKKGPIKRSYWVRASGAVKNGAKAAGGFVSRHKGKIAVAAALVGAAALAHKSGAIGGARLGHGLLKQAGAHMGEKPSLGLQARAAFHGAKEGVRNSNMASKIGAARESGGRAANRLKMGASGAMSAIRQGFSKAGQQMKQGVNHALPVAPPPSPAASKPATTRSRKKKSS